MTPLQAAGSFTSSLCPAFMTRSVHIIAPHYAFASYGTFIAVMPSDADRAGSGERMGVPEFAKEMRVATGYRSHVINSGFIARTFYEKPVAADR